MTRAAPITSRTGAMSHVGDAGIPRATALRPSSRPSRNPGGSLQ